MSFLEFAQAIHAPALRRVADHWNTARGGKRMAAWNAINPREIAGELPIVWSYRYDRAADSFTGRLSGDRIAEMFGRNLRGVPMREIYPPQDYDRLFERSKRVICEPVFYQGVGLVFQHVARYGQGERIMLPLAEDGEHGDGLLGATVYLAQSGTPNFGTGETDHWFAL